MKGAALTEPVVLMMNLWPSLGNVELEIAGCSVLCDAGNAVQRLRFAQLESPSDRYGLEPIVHTHVEKLTSVRTPPR